MADITLVRGETSITLPEDLQWSDEFNWTPVGQVVTPTLTGALIIEEAAQQAGRPITLSSLQSGGEYTAVVARTVVEALRALSVIAGAQMTLTLGDGRAFTVRWRHESGGGFTATPWKHIVPVEAGDLYTIVLKFQQV